MADVERLWKDVKDGLSNKNWNFIGPASGVLFSSFYMLQMISQRAVGKIGLHGGWPTNILAPIGCSITMANIYFSQKVEEKTREITHGYSFFPNSQYSSRYPPAADSERVQKRRFLLSFGMFVLLERGFFRTVFPSSVISLGVFGNILNKHRYSVPATSELTTESQRTKIQRLGRLFGCHQCGSRQLGIQGFIADHMPPTRFAKEAEAAWWRRLLRLKVNQRLWPQCQRCYSMQGSAVRGDIHKLVFHSIIKPNHFSTALAFLALDHPRIAEEVNVVLDPCIDFIENAVDQVRKFFQNN